MCSLAMMPLRKHRCCFFLFVFFLPRAAVGRRKTTLTSGPRGFSTPLTAPVSFLIVDEGYRLKPNHVNRSSLHLPATDEKKRVISVCLFIMLRWNMEYYYVIYVFIFILIYPEKPLGTDSYLKVQSEQRAKAL